MQERCIVRTPAFASLISAVLCSYFATSADAQVPADLPAADSRSPRIELIIPTVDGRIQWKDAASSLAQSLKLDVATVERIFPTGSLDLRSSAAVLALFGIDIALGDAVSIAMVRDEDGQPALRLTYDRDAVRFLASKHQPEAARIELDDDWIERTKHRPLVVCLHGLKSEPERFDSFRVFLRAAGYATAAVRYDDHQSIATSAQQVSTIADKLFNDPKSPELVLIGHSMGGLVAREWAENPDLENERVIGLITAGTPHAGSNWASLPPLLDLFAERKLDASDVIDVLLHQPSAPGMRELAPDSDFLKRLNSRARRGDVRYTTIVGTRSPLTENEVFRIRSTLQRIEAKSTTLRLLQPRIKPLLHSFDELVRGKGDGVVSVQRAKLDGVDDVLHVDVSHGNYFREPVGNQQQAVRDAILTRLQTFR
jgi:pimeloyl-ACP methyl ester carboxylesterase